MIKTLLLYVPVVFATVVPDDNEHRSADEGIGLLAHKLLLHHRSKPSQYPIISIITVISIISLSS